jgi:hypothetical protein
MIGGIQYYSHVGLDFIGGKILTKIFIFFPIDIRLAPNVFLFSGLCLLESF